MVARPGFIPGAQHGAEVVNAFYNITENICIFQKLKIFAYSKNGTMI